MILNPHFVSFGSRPDVSWSSPELGTDQAWVPLYNHIHPLKLGNTQTNTGLESREESAEMVAPTPGEAVSPRCQLDWNISKHVDPYRNILKSFRNHPFSHSNSLCTSLLLIPCPAIASIVFRVSCCVLSFLVVSIWCFSWFHMIPSFSPQGAQGSIPCQEPRGQGLRQVIAQGGVADMGSSSGRS